MSADGGAAFPARHDETYANGATITAHHGMSLRDYFAAKAMQAFLSQSHTGPDNWVDMGHGWGEDCANDLNRHSKVTVSTLAGFAYQAADAMLAERGK